MPHYHIEQDLPTGWVALTGPTADLLAATADLQQLAEDYPTQRFRLVATQHYRTVLAGTGALKGSRP